MNSRTISIFIITLFISAGIAAQGLDIKALVGKAPFTMSYFAKPVFKDARYLITDYGAKGDAVTLNTKAINDAIKACSGNGGGMVIVPKGIWLTGPVELLSNVNFHLEEGSLLQFTGDHTQYPIISNGMNASSYTTASPIYAYNAENIAVTGLGIIDGAGETWRPVKKDKVTEQQWNAITKTGILSTNGKVWWPNAAALNGEAYIKSLSGLNPRPSAIDYLPAREYLRPYMVYFVKCKNVLLQEVTLRNSPKFVFYPNRCSNLIMDAVNVYNDWWAQNGDGIDISACKNVIIYKCNVNAGDDGICMKSSGGNTGGAALENIIIAGCTVLRAHGGFVIGSNTDGGMKNIYVTDCFFSGTDVGVRVKSNSGRGGLVSDIYIDHIRMKHIVHESILFTTYYEDVPAGKALKDVNTKNNTKIPEFTRFYISDIQCDGAGQAISVTGLPQMPAHHIYFTNLDIRSDKGFECTDASDLVLKQVTIKCVGKTFKTNGCKNILIGE